MRKIIIIGAIVSAVISSLYTLNLVSEWRTEYTKQKNELKVKYETAYRNTREELNDLAKVQSKFVEYFSQSPSKEQIQRSLDKSSLLISAQYVSPKDQTVIYSGGRKRPRVQFPKVWTPSEKGGWIGVKRGRDSYSLYGFYATPIKNSSNDEVKGYLIGCYELPKTALGINDLIYTFSSFGEILDHEGNPIVHPFLYTKLARETTNVVRGTPQYIEPLPHTDGWKIVFHLKKGDLMPENITLLKKKLFGEALWCITLLFVLAIVLNAHQGKTLTLAILASVFIVNSLFIVAFVISRFLANNALNHENAQDMKEIYKKIALYRDECVIIPTLIQIENIDLGNSSSYVLSGFVQQTYPNDYNEEVGIIFPDEIKSSNSKIDLISKINNGDETVYIWQFSLEMGKLFHQRNFPLDRRYLDFIMWPTSMNKKVFFIPDTVSYEDMRPHTLPGVSNAVEINNWVIEHSFFGLNYREFPTYVDQRLPFNTEFKIIVQRSLINAFLTNLTPLFICMILTYAMLCVPIKKLDSPTLPSISIVIATIFVVSLNQTSLRSSLGIHAFAYVEFLYTAYYILLLLMTVNFIVYTTSSKPVFVIGYRENLVPKLVYWPVLVGMFTAVMCLGFV